MEYARQDVVDVLRRAGLPDVAEAASEQLPDPVDVDDVEAWGMRHGVTRDLLISRLGGSS